MKKFSQYVFIAPLAVAAAVYPGAEGIIIQKGQEAARFVPEYTLPIVLSPELSVEKIIWTERIVFASTASTTATGEQVPG